MESGGDESENRSQGLSADKHGWSRFIANSKA